MIQGHIPIKLDGPDEVDGTTPLLDTAGLGHFNRLCAGRTAEERVALALDGLPGTHVLTSSFGAQAAVSLHLLSRVRRDIPVILLDTGYLFPETYEFIGELAERLALNLHVYSARMSSAMQEAVYGRRWQQGLEGIEAYNHDNKVEPLKRALDDLKVGTWFTGLRRSQGPSRARTPFVGWVDGRYKVAPIADWTDRDVSKYLKQHHLPYHPLWSQGYISIGDVHTTRPIHEVDEVEQTRFFGLKRECGIHTDCS